MQKISKIVSAVFEIAVITVDFLQSIFGFRGPRTGPSPCGQTRLGKHPDHLVRVGAQVEGAAMYGCTRCYRNAHARRCQDEIWNKITA